MATLEEVKKSLGEEAEVRTRMDPRLIEKATSNIMEVLDKKHGVKVKREDITEVGWPGRSEDTLKFTIKPVSKSDEVAGALMERWKEEGARMNAYINQELTWARRNRAKILRKAKSLRTVERWFLEKEGDLKFVMLDKDANSKVLQNRKNTRKDKVEIYVTPHRSNGFTMMTENELLEAMHLVSETGVTPENAKDAKNLRAKEGHVVADGRQER
jgi:hypothetical protein